MSDLTGHAAILGAGSWGTALAVHLGHAGKDVRIWGPEADVLASIDRDRANPAYLPGVTIPARVASAPSMRDAMRGASYLILAVPSHVLRAVIREAANDLPAGCVVISAVKGLETDTLQRMSEVVRDEIGTRAPVVVLSGPSFAVEVARGLPTALVAASADADAVRAVQHELRSNAFRLYASDDVVGVELGGALKNVIAIAAGVVESLELGHNALAALITRGLAEISRLGCAMGARRETIGGLSGLGDLVLTCTGSLSRNHHVGIELGRGRSLADILSTMRNVAEGVRTTDAAIALGARHDVELPIAAQMADVLAGRRTPREALGCLMVRPQRGELEGD
jgi:glycerol-3-phosphate dehydrogenase (NAD(P)+)